MRQGDTAHGSSQKLSEPWKQAAVSTDERGEMLYLNTEFRKLLGGETAAKCSHGKPSYTFALLTEGSRVAAVPHLTNGTASLKVYL